MVAASVHPESPMLCTDTQTIGPWKVNGLKPTGRRGKLEGVSALLRTNRPGDAVFIFWSYARLEQGEVSINNTHQELSTDSLIRPRVNKQCYNPCFVIKKAGSGEPNCAKVPEPELLAPGPPCFLVPFFR